MNRSSDVHFVLTQLHQFFESCCIMDSQWNVISTQSNDLAKAIEIGLGTQSLKKFLNLKKGDIYIHNNPMFGCSPINKLIAIFACEQFRIVTEFTSPLSNNSNQTIPPVPLFENGKLNSELLTALSAQCPRQKEFLEKINEIVFQFQKMNTFIQQLTKNFPTLFSSDSIQSYLKSCKSEALAKIKSINYFQNSTNWKLPDQSQLKMKIATHELGIQIDFSGTTVSDFFQISEVKTDSLVMAVLSEFFQFSHKMNAGTFELFQISKPIQSLINSKKFVNQLYSDTVAPKIVLQMIFDIFAGKNKCKSTLWLSPVLAFRDAESNSISIIEIYPIRQTKGALEGRGFDPNKSSYSFSNQKIISLLCDNGKIKIKSIKGSTKPNETAPATLAFELVPQVKGEFRVMTPPNLDLDSTIYKKCKVEINSNTITELETIIKAEDISSIKLEWT